MMDFWDGFWLGAMAGASALVLAIVYCVLFVASSDDGRKGSSKGVTDQPPPPVPYKRDA